MPRPPRFYLPGAVFHLTARTQDRRPWFGPATRWSLVRYTAEALRASDADLLAYAIMPNHLHLVVRQGTWPLGRVMQPLLQRAAILVQRRRGVEGHVFERRFADRACLNADYLRNAIVYVHLNPVRAGLVEEAGDYPWTSHRAYAPAAVVSRRMRGVLTPEDGLRLFAGPGDRTPRQMRKAYAQHVGWRVARDQADGRTATDAGAALPRPPDPAARASEAHRFAPLFVPRFAGRSRGPEARPDLTLLARQTMREYLPHGDLELVRSNFKGRQVVHVRRRMVLRMSRAGHSGRAIARYLRISPQAVSDILAGVRRPSPSR